MARRAEDISDELLGRTVGGLPATVRGEPAPDLSDDLFYQAISPGLPPKRPQPPAAPPKEGVGLGDYVSSVMIGGANLAQGFGWLAKQVGAENIGKSIEDLGTNAVDYWTDRLSPAAKDALSREFVHRDEVTGDLSWGNPTLSTVGLMGAQSLLGTAAGMGTGGLATRGLMAGLDEVLNLFGNPMGRTVLAKAAAAGSVAAAKKLNLINEILGAAGGGLGEGITSAVTDAQSVDQAVRALPVAKLQNSPRFQEIYNSTDENMAPEDRLAYARDTLAKEASSTAGWQSGLVVSLLGAPMGAFFGRIIGNSGRLANTALGSLGKAALGEAAQEAAQSAVEQQTIDRQLVAAGQTDLDTFQDMVNNAIGGAAAGGALGGAVGAFTHTDVPAQKPGQVPRGTPAPQQAVANAAMRAARAGANQQEVLAAVQSGASPLERISALRKLGDEAVASGAEAPVEPPPGGSASQAPPSPLDVESEIDQLAHSAATSPLNPTPEPTPEQIEAENYEAGRIPGAKVGMRSIDLAVEHPKGTLRHGIEMTSHYGRIPGAVGGDGMALDFFMGPNPDAPNVYVYHRLDHEGRFHQHKPMIGFDSEDAARAELQHFYRSDNVPGPIVTMSKPEFEGWVANGNTGAPVPGSGLPIGRNYEGHETKVVTGSGQSIPARYKLVELADLTSSHALTGKPNGRYPQELQPRDRSRAGLRQWIVETANRFEPGLAVEGVGAESGAPIIGPDNVVESGNGRVAVLTKLYNDKTTRNATDKSTPYRTYLEQHAERFGFTPEQVQSLARPVLVRARTEAMDMEARARFTRDANRPSLSVMSPTEQARADAQTLTPEALQNFSPDDNGNVLAPSNSTFVRQFLQGMPAAERAGVLTADGQPTRQLAQRIQAAVFSHAYQDDRALSLMAEEANPDVRNVVAALTQAAPTFARARAAGALSQADVVTPLMQAVDILRTTRASGQSVDEYLGQGGLFGSTPPEVASMARFLDRNIRSPKRMGQALTHLASHLENQALSQKSGSLIPEAPLNVETALQAANQRMEAEHGPSPQGGLFERQGQSFQVEDGGATYETGERKGPLAAAGAKAPANQMDLFLAPVVENRGHIERLAKARGVQTGTFRTAITKVQSFTDAAHVLAPLRRGAQEHLTALVTDQHGRPLAVLRAQIGDVYVTNYNSAHLLGQASNIPGAAELWLSHNHPSGDPNQSQADHTSTDRLQRLAEGTGLKVRGMVTFGANTKEATFYNRIQQERRFPIPPGARAASSGTAVPHYGERRLLTRGPLADQNIIGPADARRVLAELNPKDRPGVLFLDWHSSPVAWVPLSIDEMQKLRTGSLESGAGKLVREIESSNATKAVLVAPEGQDTAIRNMATFFGAHQIAVTDAMLSQGEGKPLVSMVSRGEAVVLNPGGTFYSRSGEYAAREPGETDKAYAKRAIDTRPAPTSIPYAPERYFTNTATMMPVGQLVASKPGNENSAGGPGAAPQRLMAAYEGALPRREPITVQALGDGHYKVVDGNGTLRALRDAGWARVPVQLVGEQIKPRGPVHWSPDAVYRHAIQNQARLADIGKRIADALGIEFKNPGVKGRADAEAKAAERKGQPLSYLNDIVRGGFITDSMAEGDRVLEALQKEGLGTHDEGLLVTPAGFSNRVVLVTFPDGQVGELQMWPQAVYEAKVAHGDPIYREQRSLMVNGEIQDFERWQEYDRQAQQYYIPAILSAPAWASDVGRASPRLAALIQERQAPSSMAPPLLRASPASTFAQEPARQANAATEPEGVRPVTTGSPSQFRNAPASPGMGVTGRSTVESVSQTLQREIDAVREVVPVNVVQSVQDLPDPTAPPDVEGAYYQDGQVYLVADNIRDAAHGRDVMRHELGHASMERHPQLAKRVEQVKRSIRAKGFRDLVSEVRARQGLLDETTEAKEVMALAAERGVKGPVMESVRAAVRDFGRSLGFDMGTMSDADLNRVVSMMGRDLDRDARIMRDFRAAQGLPAVKALEKAEPTDQEIVDAINAIYEGRGDAIDSPPETVPGSRVADIQNFGDLELVDHVQVEGEEGTTEVRQSAQRVFEGARDRVKLLERLRTCLTQ